MAFQYLTNVPLKKAREDYLQMLREQGYPCDDSSAERSGRERNYFEQIKVVEAAGRVTATPIYAKICAPHYPACAMDGIAICAKATDGATETTPVILTPDRYVMVDTGDPLPENCDAVVMIEDVVRQPDDTVKLHNAAAPWQHIRQIGEDICAGEMILGSQRKITPAVIGACLAAGVMNVSVIRKPVVGIIPTGDEIVPPTEDPKPGDIIEFNSSIFGGMLKEWGAEVRTSPIVPDKFDRICEALKTAGRECDIVLINAGSSAGREDYSARAIETIGEVCCHGIAIKPGKPAILGCMDGRPVVGIPGYPVSGMIVLEELVRPLIEVWYEKAAADVFKPAEAEDVCSSEKKGPVICPEKINGYETVKAVLTRPVISGLKYEEFVRVRLGLVNGRVAATPLNRGAGVVSSMVKADGILVIPQNVEGYEAGAEVKVRLLRSYEELAHTLVAIGSHDPLLDELADMIHVADPGAYMSSAHVGSLGGIMAIRRGEAHLGGTHLLDENDGTYNISYVKKYFPNGGVRLVECVYRTQGIMVAPGNPMEIKDIAGLAGGKIRYVNRQKGSGTRVLMDYLCRKEGIDTGTIYGYDREEFTHTAVAAQIAGGTADAGLGIYSAAQLYGLEFIPVCMEQYDLLIPDYAWETPEVQRMIGILQSPAFRERLEAMGGYRIECPGRIRMQQL